MCFHGLYLPFFFPLLTDRRQVFFYTEYFVLCGFFILFAFVTKSDEKDPYYCFTGNSLVAVCAHFLTDFHWNAAWREQKNSWLCLKSKQYLRDPYCQGWNREKYHLLSGQHISCHWVLYRIVAPTDLRISIQIYPDLIWTTCGSFLNIVHLNVFFSNLSQRCNPANFMWSFQNYIF